VRAKLWPLIHGRARTHTEPPSEPSGVCTPRGCAKAAGLIKFEAGTDGVAGTDLEWEAIDECAH